MALTNERSNKTTGLANPTTGDNGFWHEAIAIQGSVSPRIVRHVLAFGLLATVIEVGALAAERQFGVKVGLPVAPHEIAGALLGLILVLRTNSGYDRWWEARKLWGGIVNQSRNLAIAALAYGPKDRHWQEQFVRWSAVFSHAARQSLRRELAPEEFEQLLGTANAQELAAAQHMPSYVAYRLAELLEQATATGRMSSFAFLQIDRERALLIDHIGACERILKTPLPLVYSIKIRRFILLFLLSLPFALLHRIGADLWVPVITMMIAYPLISLDQIGVELQNPFAQRNLSHLPLGAICETIETNLLADLSWAESRTDQHVPPSDGQPAGAGYAGEPG